MKKVTLRDVLDKAATAVDNCYDCVEASVTLGFGGRGTHRFTFEEIREGERFFHHTGIDDEEEIVSQTELMKFYGKGVWWLDEEEVKA